MRGKKRLSPFQLLMQEIESLMVELVGNLQLAMLDPNAPTFDDKFTMGKFLTLKFLLERGYAIANRRSIGNELVNVPEEMPVEQWIAEFKEATKNWDW